MPPNEKVRPPGTTPGGTNTNEAGRSSYRSGDGAVEGGEGYLRYTNPDEAGLLNPEHPAAAATDPRVPKWFCEGKPPGQKSHGGAMTSAG